MDRQPGRLATQRGAFDGSQGSAVDMVAVARRKREIPGGASGPLTFRRSRSLAYALATPRRDYGGSPPFNRDKAAGSLYQTLPGTFVRRCASIVRAAIST